MKLLIWGLSKADWMGFSHHVIDGHQLIKAGSLQFTVLCLGVKLITGVLWCLIFILLTWFYLESSTMHTSRCVCEDFPKRFNWEGKRYSLNHSFTRLFSQAFCHNNEKGNKQSSQLFVHENLNSQSVRMIIIIVIISWAWGLIVVILGLGSLKKRITSSESIWAKCIVRISLGKPIQNEEFLFTTLYYIV